MECKSEPQVLVNLHVGKYALVLSKDSNRERKTVRMVLIL